MKITAAVIMIHLKTLQSSVVMTEVTTDRTESELLDEHVSVPLYGCAVLLHVSGKFSGMVYFNVFRPIHGCPLRSVGVATIPANSCQTPCIPLARAEVFAIQFLRCSAFAART